MGKRKDISNATSYVDQYRKQLGRQETKRDRTRVKEIKEKDAKKETVNKFKNHLVVLLVILMVLFAVYISYKLFFI